MVACAPVETSTGNHRPCGRRYGIQPVEHHARLHHGRARVLIEIEDLVQVFAELSMHQGRAHGLAALRGAAAARQDAARPARAAIWMAMRASSSVCGTTTPTGSIW